MERVHRRRLNACRSTPDRSNWYGYRSCPELVTELLVSRVYSDGATIDREPHPQRDEGLEQARANH